MLDANLIKEFLAYGTTALLLGMASQFIIELFMIGVTAIVHWFRRSV